MGRSNQFAKRRNVYFADLRSVLFNTVRGLRFLVMLQTQRRRDRRENNYSFRYSISGPHFPPQYSRFPAPDRRPCSIAAQRSFAQTALLANELCQLARLVTPSTGLRLRNRVMICGPLMKHHPQRESNGAARPRWSGSGTWTVPHCSSCLHQKESIVASDYVEERGGGYFINGSRVSLDSVVYAFSRGESPEGIAESFPLLNLEQIFGGWRSIWSTVAQ